MFCLLMGITLLPTILLAATTVPDTGVVIPNPLGTTDPRVIIAQVIQGIFSIIGSLSLLMFVYGGFLWITSMGESKRIERGKTIIVWTVAGLAIMASSYVIVNAVINGLTTGSAT